MVSLHRPAQQAAIYAERKSNVVGGLLEQSTKEKLVGLYVLQGLLRETTSVAGVALRDLGITEDKLTRFHDRYLSQASQGEDQDPGTVEMASLLVHGEELAQNIENNPNSKVGTEHLLVALMRRNDPALNRFLSENKLTADDVENEVFRLLGKTHLCDFTPRLMAFSETFQNLKGKKTNSREAIELLIKYLHSTHAGFNPGTWFRLESISVHFPEIWRNVLQSLFTGKIKDE